MKLGENTERGGMAGAGETTTQQAAAATTTMTSKEGRGVQEEDASTYYS